MTDEVAGQHWPDAADLLASATRMLSQGTALFDEGQYDAAYGRLVQAAASFSALPVTAKAVEC